ncbi:hypothetical protein [Ruania rhizosphaerae]|uniref:hypothetical protein n=1 Tax=Ruania rhizosphaerae TaxID=1840413 RepID=UPI001359199F|nr:hypothetical protein [Ruania rhizosphaerae]
MPDTTSEPHTVPLRVALLLAVLEAAVLILVGVTGVVSSALAGGAMLAVNVGVLVVLVLFALLLAAAVRALHQGRRWGRGPVVTWQLLQVAVLVSSFAQLPWWLTIPGIASAIAVTVCLLLPTSLAATSGSGNPDAVL